MYSFFLVSGSLYGYGEKTMVLGAGSTWNAAENRAGIIEVGFVRPYPVLALSSAPMEAVYTLGGASLSGLSAAQDLVLSFDEGNPDRFTDRTGHYSLSAASGIDAADQRWAHSGSGAALFSINTDPAQRGEGPLVIIPRNGDALFAPGREIRDFTIEFWLYPLYMENGEQILSWTAAGQGGMSGLQRIQCTASKNRLQWTFQNFFSLPDNSRSLNLSVRSSSAVTPRTWSHHLIRFDSTTGLFEYLLNGRLESVTYATASGREGGEIYTPAVGTGGSLVLGSRFAGLMDEFSIHGAYIESPELVKYANQGGRLETRPLDLGERNSSILKVEAFGGRTSINGNTFRGTIQNEYNGAGTFSFPDDSALQFFIRTADSPYGWNNLSDADAEASWIPFEPGTELAPAVRGRYVQLAAVFYPSGDGETTPYLDEIRIRYRPDTPPNPPSSIAAIARDGAVDLSWKAGSDADTAGYMVYYGTSRGEYFGTDAIIGASPVDVGKQTSLRIDGLKNGVLYYFAVSVYDQLGPTHSGEFSREVSARPLRKNE
jgi:hypothetical protein